MLKGISLLTASNFFTFIINLLLLPIITHLYSPENYGLFITCMAIVLLLNPLLSLRLEGAFFLEKTESRCIYLLCLSFIFLFFISIFFTIFFKISAPYLKMAQVSVLLFLFLLFFSGLNKILLFWNNAFSFYRKIAFARVVESLSNNLLAIFLFFINFEKIGLILARMLSFFFSSFFLLYKNLNIKLCKNLSLNEAFYLLKKYKNFPLYSSWSFFIDSLSRESMPILVAICYSATEAGFYGLVYRVLNIPMKLIGDATSRVFFQYIADNKEDFLKIHQKVREIFYFLFNLFFPFFLIIFFFGDSLFSYLFGSKWYQAGKYAQILIFMFFFIFITRPYSVFFEIYGYQKVRLVFSGVNFLTRVLPIFLGKIFNIILYKVFAIIVFLNFFWAVLLLYYAFRLVHYNFAMFLCFFLKENVYWIFSILSLFLLRTLKFHFYWKILFLFFIFCLQYLILWRFNLKFREKIIIILSSLKIKKA